MSRISNAKYLSLPDKFVTLLVGGLAVLFLVLTIGLATTTGLTIEHLNVFKWYALLSLVVTLITFGLTLYLALTFWSFLKLDTDLIPDFIKITQTKDEPDTSSEPHTDPSSESTVN